MTPRLKYRRRLEFTASHGESSLHHASIFRVHAAIALERGRSEEAAQHVNIQRGQLELRGTEQRAALKKANSLIELQM